MSDVRIEQICIRAFTVPTETPESDGTFEWNKTTIVLVNLRAEGTEALGYSYADAATATLIREVLAPIVIGCNPLMIGAVWRAMLHAIRNLGRPGIASMAIAAVDNALWDLKGKLLNTAVAALLPCVRQNVEAYGSGGFTSFTETELLKQMTVWAEAGFRAVKMKVGRDAKQDVIRVQAVRKAIGPHVQLFVDANGAYSRKQALHLAHVFRESDVTWFEEPVVADDLDGLHLLRDRGPAGMQIAAGEYGYTSQYFSQMLNRGAVDVLQADATRCAGISGFLQADALCDANNIPLSSHTAPSVHAHCDCAGQRVIHAEYFSDHVRIEKMAFAGAAEAKAGFLQPDLSRPGPGLEWKTGDMLPDQIYQAECRG